MEGKVARSVVRSILRRVTSTATGLNAETDPDLAHQFPDRCSTNCSVLRGRRASPVLAVRFPEIRVHRVLQLVSDLLDRCTGNPRLMCAEYLLSLSALEEK